MLEINRETRDALTEAVKREWGVAEGGYVTCTYNDCPDPGAPSDALGA